MYMYVHFVSFIFMAMFRGRDAVRINSMSYLSGYCCISDLSYDSICCCLCSCSKPLQNYMVFNDTEGVYTYTFEYEKKVHIQILLVGLF